MAKTILENNIIKIGKEPMVILPLTEWKKVEGMIEDAEMYSSENFRKNIEKARREVDKGQILTLAEVERKLKMRK